MLIPCDEVNILNTFRVMIILRLLLLLTNLHLKLLVLVHRELALRNYLALKELNKKYVNHQCWLLLRRAFSCSLTLSTLDRRGPSCISKVGLLPVVFITRL